MTTPLIIDHLWQSSCFALLTGLLAFVLRKNSPKVRYWVWLSASLKFLIPFALLVSLGSVVPRPARHPVSVAAPVFPNTLVQIAEPFSPAHKATVPAHAALHRVPVAIGAVWALGFLAITLARCRSWLGVRAALRAGTPIELPIPVRALITPGAEGPGIVGFLRPVLVLPAQLVEHLNPPQLGAILAHELCHVRRRDNLFAAVHMVVETIFWFHPLVWWIGRRMVEERELACDEEVLRMGCEPTDYVEGILKVCRFYTESPLPCVSGVTGADVKRRLRTILRGRLARELNAGKKVVLAAIGLAAFAVPIFVGMLNSPASRAQSRAVAAPQFEAASIKPSTRCGPGRGVTPGRLSLCGSLAFYIRGSYDLFTKGRGFNSSAMTNFWTADIKGAPSWLNSESYQIEAKAEGNPPYMVMMGPMLQALLEDRLKLKTHLETREVPVYELTPAKGGLKLRRLPDGNCISFDPAQPPSEASAPGQASPKPCGGASIGRGKLDFAEMSMAEFSQYLGRNILDRPVIDKTGIAGRFNFHLEFAPDETTPLLRRSDDQMGPSIFTAIQEQLGLKLERAKGPSEFLVIDHIERPSEN